MTRVGCDSDIDIRVETQKQRLRRRDLEIQRIREQVPEIEGLRGETQR